MKFSKHEKKKCPKSVLRVATIRCNTWWYKTCYGVKQILTVLWKRILYCLCVKPNFASWNGRTQITNEMPKNQIPHVLNTHIPNSHHCGTVPLHTTANARWKNPPSWKPIILPRFNSISCWNFSFIRRRDILRSH